MSPRRSKVKTKIMFLARDQSLSFGGILGSVTIAKSIIKFQFKNHQARDGMDLVLLQNSRDLVGALNHWKAVLYYTDYTLRNFSSFAKMRIKNSQRKYEINFSFASHMFLVCFLQNNCNALDIKPWPKALLPGPEHGMATNVLRLICSPSTSKNTSWCIICLVPYILSDLGLCNRLHSYSNWVV